MSGPHEQDEVFELRRDADLIMQSITKVTHVDSIAHLCVAYKALRDQADLLDAAIETSTTETQ